MLIQVAIEKIVSNYDLIQVFDYQIPNTIMLQ